MASGVKRAATRGRRKSDTTTRLNPSSPPHRHISEADVKDTLSRGTVDRSRSALDKAPCAKLVAARGRVTVVADACPADTGIITVIDTESNWACDCP